MKYCSKKAEKWWSNRRTVPVIRLITLKENKSEQWGRLIIENERRRGVWWTGTEGDDSPGGKPAKKEAVTCDASGCSFIACPPFPLLPLCARRHYSANSSWGFSDGWGASKITGEGRYTKSIGSGRKQASIRTREQSATWDFGTCQDELHKMVWSEFKIRASHRHLGVKCQLSCLLFAPQKPQSCWFLSLLLILSSLYCRAWKPGKKLNLRHYVIQWNCCSE